eukprot:TRINITY_DN13593_c0_g1_i1.p1 TRINITY_DN13593_c0_g1~~TRINITY_DN13593_c0_g1_i1.p1  ORF type:complete len:206 (+),score=23.33 TRINITY_DN13593_c0_g1_i1:42-659(+)
MGCCVNKEKDRKVQENEVSIVVLKSGDAKKLRMHPSSKSEYVACLDKIRITPGTRMTVVGKFAVCAKYTLVRVHGTTGFLRKRHLIPVDNVEAIQKLKREVMVALWCLVGKEVPSMCCTGVISMLMTEVVPWWLLTTPVDKRLEAGPQSGVDIQAWRQIVEATAVLPPPLPLKELGNSEEEDDEDYTHPFTVDPAAIPGCPFFLS